ncbi:hypothetical protein [Phenylobacterium montanum]|uniref:Uncharacterized protein n=1 Tax=Phenylobacterium montanum TaxID=2823693 RepID=A0A975ITK6_9CAUL|nr:hypothetical protein [Caulobacter sp. S6]QUD86835.1 hypothetical protein KCG34_17380 [Caulobacter sp. S6]
MLGADLLAALHKLDEQAEDRRDPGRFWAVPDVPIDVRATAEWQARSRGESLGVWMTAAILNHARAPEAPTTATSSVAFSPDPAPFAETGPEDIFQDADAGDVAAPYEIEAPFAPEPPAADAPAHDCEPTPVIEAEAEAETLIVPCEQALESPEDDLALEMIAAFPADAHAPEEEATAEQPLPPAAYETAYAGVTAWAPAFQPANTLHGGSGMDLIRETIHGIIAYAAPAPMPETGFVVGDADLAEAGDAAATSDDHAPPIMAWSPPEALEPRGLENDDRAAQAATYDAPQALRPKPRRSWLGFLSRRRD